MSTSWFYQVSPSTFETAKKLGGKYAVAVKQIEDGSSEDWSQNVSRWALNTRGLHTCWPGGDGWDNPCMCLLITNSEATAKFIVERFPKSVIHNLENEFEYPPDIAERFKKIERISAA